MSTSDSSLLKKTHEELKVSDNISFVLSPCLNVGCKCQESDLMQSREDLSDPFLLDDPCVMKILSFLKPKEILESLVVCQSWKQYIESSDLLMNRIYDGVILSINFREKKVPGDFRPSYKHMSLKFPDLHVSEMQENNANLLLKRFAPSLDTLRISHYYDHSYREFMPHPLCYLTNSFPALRKLRIEHFWHPFQMLQNSSFPALEVLHITAGWEDMMLMYMIRFSVFLGHFPKLKHLMIEFGDEPGDFIDDSEDVSSLPLLQDMTQPQLETIAFPSSNYMPFTLRNQQNSLTKLSVYELDLKSLSCCLRDLKKLKCLSIWYIAPYGDKELIILPINDSIEVLRIHFCPLSTDKLSRVIIKLPSLKELAVVGTKELIDIRFIASNMRHFERLLVSNDQAYLPVYREIQDNANQYINTSFVILNAFVNNIDYESFEEFDFE